LSNLDIKYCCKAWAVCISCAGVDYKLSTKITAVDAKAKTVTAESGDTISYEKLIYALGARVSPNFCSSVAIDSLCSIQLKAEVPASSYRKYFTK